MEKSKLIIIFIICVLWGNAGGKVYGSCISLRPVTFEQVYLEEFFWYYQSEDQLKKTIPAVWSKLVQDGLWDRRQRSSELNDVDFYRVVENMSYINFFKKDSLLGLRLDSAVALIRKRVDRNGRMDQIYQKSRKPASVRATQAAFCRMAMAHCRATGDRCLLELAMCMADNIYNKVIKTGRIPDELDAPEWGIAFCDLYRMTGITDYLTLASRWVKAHQPSVDPDSIRGYVYAAMTDVAALSGDTLLLQQVHQQWVETVRRNMRITGGFEPDRSFQGTLSALEWSFRLYLATRDIRCFEVSERIWYNELRAGISMDGLCFAHTVRLSGDRSTVARYPLSEGYHYAILLSSAFAKFADMIYATDACRDIYIAQYVRGAVQVKTDSLALTLDVMGSMPWAGGFFFTIHSADSVPQSARFHIRVPGWLGDDFLPGIGGYVYQPIEKPRCRLYVNGIERRIVVNEGYIIVEGTWKDGDRINYLFPEPVRRVFREEVAKVGQVAFQRGPFVYCFETPDVPDTTLVDKWICPKQMVSTRFVGNFLTGVQIITGKFFVPVIQSSGNDVTGQDTLRQNKDTVMPFMAFPYYAWGNRPGSAMRVWMPCRSEN